MKTTPCRFLFSQETTTSVNCSQPFSLWDVAWWARTVRTALSRSTPSTQTKPQVSCLLLPLRRPNGNIFIPRYPARAPRIDFALQMGCAHPQICFLGCLTLLGPASQIAVTRMGEVFNISRQFFVNVFQTEVMGERQKITNCAPGTKRFGI